MCPFWKRSLIIYEFSSKDFYLLGGRVPSITIPLESGRTLLDTISNAYVRVASFLHVGVSLAARWL